MSSSSQVNDVPITAPLSWDTDKKSPSAKSEQYWVCSVSQLIFVAGSVFAVQLGIVTEKKSDHCHNNQQVFHAYKKHPTPQNSK